MALRTVIAATTTVAGVIAAGTVDAPAYVQVARELGSFGLVAFIVYWVFTRTLPKMTADHKEAVDLLTKSQRESLNSVISDSRETRELFECHLATISQFMRQQGIKTPKLKTDEDSKT